MQKTVILTGWGWIDYACAAALALRQNKGATVLGMSTRRLPEFLDFVTGFKNILILGVGLTGNPDLLLRALKKLERRKVAVRWISALPIPEEISGIAPHINPFVGDESLTAAVGQCLELPYDDLKPLLKAKIPTAMRHWSTLLEAAMFFYRNYQDVKAYGRAISLLAHGVAEAAWPTLDRQMVEHYRRYSTRELIGKSAAILELQDKINRIAPHEHARVLILGESGTGKETVALQIHNKSPRRNEPFIAFNCASVTSDLLESRLFGDEKGAFTGASEQRKGLFEQANGGTLFLDEIGELPLEAQGLLLRVLEGGRFTRIGDREEVMVDVRLLTATNRNLARQVRDGHFRSDLFHRLNVVQLQVPPLRDHLEDIEHIANSFWLGRHKRRLSVAQIAALKSYDYPGNVRELINLLDRADVLGEDDFEQLITEQRRLMADLTPPAIPEIPDNLSTAMSQHIRRIYEKYDANISKAATALEISRNTVKKYLAEN